MLSGTIESFDDIIMRTPEDYKKKDIEVIIEVEVIAVDSDKKTVTYEQDGNEIVMDYDKLVFATGGNPSQLAPVLHEAGEEGTAAHVHDGGQPVHARPHRGHHAPRVPCTG